MVREKWFTSDTHFCHRNIIKFCERPFANVDEMNEALVNNWNSVVGPNDYVYHLGDWFVGGNDRERNEILWSLNGKIRFIVGNHDEALLKSKSSLNRFEKIMYWKGFKEHNFTATHVPHELKRLRDGAFNVHGHIHNNVEEDLHYLNVCVEVRNYTPVHISQIISEIEENSRRLRK